MGVNRELDNEMNEFPTKEEVHEYIRTNHPEKDLFHLNIVEYEDAVVMQNEEQTTRAVKDD